MNRGARLKGRVLNIGHFAPRRVGAAIEKEEGRLKRPYFRGRPHPEGASVTRRPRSDTPYHAISPRRRSGSDGFALA
jgi:hypothetical protein